MVEYSFKVFLIVSTLEMCTPPATKVREILYFVCPPSKVCLPFCEKSARNPFDTTTSNTGACSNEQQRTKMV
eukprot:TRINITY_DN2021_c0_g2_i1.p1 TRINITY_DN2021_c0_g2~~TRINITY_DN2021_c0_g2_i1.p1  ORF type:complete len:72 (-),score=2.83 TRINITY_DN2021_c0_g2_i1:82-297(-)